MPILFRDRDPPPVGLRAEEPSFPIEGIADGMVARFAKRNDAAELGVLLQFVLGNVAEDQETAVGGHPNRALNKQKAAGERFHLGLGGDHLSELGLVVNLEIGGNEPRQAAPRPEPADGNH